MSLLLITKHLELSILQTEQALVLIKQIKEEPPKKEPKVIIDEE